MSRNDLMLTAVGWVATKPKEVTGGVPFTSFRLASTPRYFDSRAGAWADGRTEWLTVKVFRDVALNVAGSVTKGDPVLVHGRMCTEEWQGENGLRTTLVLEAVALGHDLTRGRARFVRTTRGTRADAADADAPVGDERGPVTVVVDPWAVESTDGEETQGTGLGDGRGGPERDLRGSAEESTDDVEGQHTDAAEVVGARTP